MKTKNSLESQVVGGAQVPPRLIGSICLLAGVMAVTALTSCTERETGATATSPADQESRVTAVAHLSPTQGNNVRGTVRFIQEDDGVRVVVDLQGLTPGEHGFHVHENGDCSSPDGSSAGGHFNPTSQPHAGRDAANRHVGDMGNITAGADGKAQADYVDQHLTLSGANSIVGKAMIVHAGRDDLQSQPSGDAGGRVACGVIEREPDATVAR